MNSFAKTFFTLASLSTFLLAAADNPSSAPQSIETTKGKFLVDKISKTEWYTLNNPRIVLDNGETVALSDKKNAQSPHDSNQALYVCRALGYELGQVLMFKHKENREPFKVAFFNEKNEVADVAEDWEAIDLLRCGIKVPSQP